LRGVCVILALALVTTAAACGGRTTARTITVQDTITVVRTKTVVTAGGTSTQVVYVPAFGGKLVEKPTEIGVGASNLIKNIRWRSYGGDTAVGRGVESNPACTAACPNGEPVWLRTTVKLKTIVACQGVPIYSEMVSTAISGVGSVPLDCPPS
jgi:hypothetical protein